MELEEQVSAAPESAVGSQGEAGSEAAQAEETAKAEGEGAGTGAEENERANNARMAAARRTGERQARKSIDAEFEALGMRDQNGRAITSKEEALAYFRQVKEQEYGAEAKKTGKTVEQVRAEDQERQRGRRVLNEERSEAERQEFMAQDIADFRAANPTVDIQKLLSNTAFQRFCGSRLGREPMSELYDDYVELYGEAEKTANAKGTAKSERGTGSGSGKSAGDGLTAAQQEALAEWNRENPRMKMTAKEFLSYGG